MSAPAPAQDASNLMDLTRRAAGLFLAQSVEEKQAFLIINTEISRRLQSHESLWGLDFAPPPPPPENALSPIADIFWGAVALTAVLALALGSRR